MNNIEKKAIAFVVMIPLAFLFAEIVISLFALDL